jgi:hypothetical protein
MASAHVGQVEGHLWVVRICLDSVRQIRTVRCCDGTEDIFDQIQCPNIFQRQSVKDDSKPAVITTPIGLGSGEEHVAMTGVYGRQLPTCDAAAAGFSWELSLAAATATRASSDCRI